MLLSFTGNYILFTSSLLKQRHPLRRVATTLVRCDQLQTAEYVHTHQSPCDFPPLDLGFCYLFCLSYPSCPLLISFYSSFKFHWKCLLSQGHHLAPQGPAEDAAVSTVSTWCCFYCFHIALQSFVCGLLRSWKHWTQCGQGPNCIY